MSKRLGLLLALAVAFAPAAFAKTTSCPNGTSSNNSTTSNVKAKGISCAKAAMIAQPAGSKSHGSGLSPSSHYKTMGFKCKGFSPGPTGRTWVWSCKHKQKKVTFEVTL